MRVALKVAVWIGSLWPLGVLVRGFLTDDLGANPIEYVTRTLGLTALVLILTSLGMTPLRALFGWSSSRKTRPRRRRRPKSARAGGGSLPINRC